jgi:dTDP-4-amino-4,6-dideoxyglucose
MPAILGDAPAFEQTVNIVRPVFPEISEFENEFSQVLKSGQVTNNSRYVIELEKLLADYLGVKYALAFCNGEAALMIMLKAAELKGEIIVPSYTFSGTAHAAIWNNLTPVFADIDAETLTIDPRSVEQKIGPATSAILAAPVYGNPCDNDALQEIADRHKLKLLYDSASGFGCSYKGKRLGGFGEAEIFSFHATKVFPTMEGGALTTNDLKMYEVARQLRNFGQAGPVDCSMAGMNGKMMEISALIGIHLLKDYESVIAHRLKIAKAYEQQLAPLPGLRMQKVMPNNLSTYLYLALVVDADEFGLSRDDLIEALAVENITARRFLDPPVHRMSYYVNNFGSTSLPVVEDVASRAVALPLFSDMTFA